ncbi:MAG: 2-dehydropantoate 2-reductase [Bacteroidaceae bacterium]|nr:2-dehydropantoate 2-reductase [Bacteroidaceae bacterium]
MKYAVIGTGAIGGYFGGKLANSGFDVHFLAHTDFKEMSEALVVDSCDGSFVIENPHVYSRTDDMPAVDVVIVGLKTTNNHLLPDLLKPLLGNDPVVVLIQNGVCVEEDLEQQLPGTQLVAGLAYICSTKVGPAHILHQDLGHLLLANYSCREPSVVEALARDWEKAGVRSEFTEYHLGRWRKAIWNLPFNGLAVVKDANTAQLMENAETYALTEAIMHEVVAIANALGVAELGQEHIDYNLSITKTMKPYHPSMKVDYDNHRPMEAYYLYTRAIMEADRLGIPCPNLKAVEAELRKM